MELVKGVHKQALDTTGLKKIIIVYSMGRPILTNYMPFIVKLVWFTSFFGKIGVFLHLRRDRLFRCNM